METVVSHWNFLIQKFGLRLNIRRYHLCLLLKLIQSCAQIDVVCSLG